MMPGETAPAATAAGLAAAATACPNCGTLQQNLSEYVAALIALKQKIMDTDRLLLDYKQKCNELKCTERENSAFRQQVEQMLQKLSPLEKCKEELGSVKAELEEKKSSLKIYQETHLEYVRVKEEMGKSDAMKKKLEAKVKKLEKATEKHNQDFRQLRAEKKVLEKELKKAQEKIESFPSENKKKVVKHVETQSERAWPMTDLDKEKIKLLLEELWLCIDSSTGKNHINKNDCYLADSHNNSRPHGKTKAVQNPPKPKRTRGEKPAQCSSPETRTTPTSLTSLQIKWDGRPASHVGQMENEAMETSEASSGDGPAYRRQPPESAVQTEPSAGSLEVLNKEPEEAGEGLTEILKWARPLPRLLSPIQVSPAANPDMLFGELTDSSDEEMLQDAQKVENILENHDQSAPQVYALSGKNPAEPLSEYNSSDVNNESSDPCELPGRPTVLKHDKSVLCTDPLAKSGFPNNIGGKSRDGEKHLEENSECMLRNPEIAVNSTENVPRSTADVTETENKTLACELMSGTCLQEQEKTVEPRHVQEVVTSSLEQMLNESSEDKKEELTGTVEVSVSSLIEDDQPPAHKGPQQTEEPVLAPENVMVVPEKDSSSSVIQVTVLKEGSKDIPTESDLGRARPLTEHTAPEPNRTEELCTPCNGEPGLMDRGMNLDDFKLCSETDYCRDQVQHKPSEVALMPAIEKDVCVSGASIRLRRAEENYSNEDGCCKDSECDVNEKTKLDGVDALRPKLNITQAVDGWENSLCCSSEVSRTLNECSTVPFASKNEEGDKVKTEVENIVNKDKTAKSISLAVTKGCLHLEDPVDKKDSSRWLQEEPSNMNVPVFPTQVSVVKGFLSQPVRTNRTAPEFAFTRSASELELFEDPGDKLKCTPVIHHVSNNVQSSGVITEDKCLTSERLGEDGGKPLRISPVGTTEFITAVECEKGTTSGVVLERPVPSCLATGNSPNVAPSQETTKQNDKSISPQQRKSSVEDVGMKECAVTNEAVLEMNPNGSCAQSMQDALQGENADPKAVSPDMLTASSELSTALFFGRNSPGCDVVANGQSSDPPFIAHSARADLTDHRNNGEHLMGKEADAKHSEESRPKSLDYCSHDDPDEVEIERGGQPAAEKLKELESPSSEIRALVVVKGCCDVNNSGEISEGRSLNHASAVHTSAANQTIVRNDKGPITPSSDKIGSPLKNCPVEHLLDEAVSEEMDKILNRGARSREADEVQTPDDGIAALHVSASSSSEEECPLRKVDPTKKYSRLLAFQGEPDTAWNSQAGVPTDTIVSSGIQELLHPAENVPAEDEAAHHGDSRAETVEHSYAAPWSRGKGSSALEASVPDEKEAGRSVVLANRAEVDSGEPASGKLSAGDLEGNGVISSPEAELNGTGEEPSAFSAKQEKTSAALGRSSETVQDHFTPHHFDGGPNTFLGKEDPIKKDEEMAAAAPRESSIPVDSRNPSAGNQEAVSEKSELLIKSSKQKVAEQAPKSSDFINVSAKAGAEGGGGRLLPKIPGRTGGRKSRQDSLAETVAANADASISGKPFPGTLRKIRQEMGPPLPPLLPPLLATPPRTVQPVSSIVTPSSQFSLPPPLSEELIAPACETPMPPRMSPLSDTPKRKRPPLPATPSPSEGLISERTLSSPLQFCAATPKHALPVPGRFPPPAAGSAAPAVPPENSVKILDSMYPELSARAITLNILRGNIQLSRQSPLDSKNVPPLVPQISGFKEIASSSTAFVKTGTGLFPEPPSSSASETGKRMRSSPAMPKSAKRLRLDSELLESDLGKEELPVSCSGADAQRPAEEAACLGGGGAVLSADDSRLFSPVEGMDPDNKAVIVALEKLSESCFDLFPVIRSRVHVGNTSSIPVLTDEEKEVVYEFGVAKKCLAERILHTILKKLKYQKTSLGPCLIQSLCRVYVGICRQLRDLEKARLFCYSLLKEDFPQPGKLILFMGNMWSEVFTSEGVINKAIQLVARKRSRGQVLKCLKSVLRWEESGPADIGMMISTLLFAIQLCPQMEFHVSEQHGEDLKESMWEYVFAIDLLCSHQKWGWTHDHIISKELWPIMDKWIKNRKSSGNSSSPSDVIVATVLRLIGRLSQIGLKEGFSSAVKNISSVLGAFLQHAKEKDVPWSVQLAAVYALCEMGPSSPSEISEALSAWAAVNGNSLPPAVTSSISEVSRLLEP